MKKTFVLLCMMLIMPIALSAQSKEIFNGVLATYYELDDNLDLKTDNSEIYKEGGSCSYYYADKITPKYFSLIFKLTDGKGGRAAGVDSQYCTMEKLRVSTGEGYSYRFIHDWGDGTYQAIWMTTEMNKLLYPEIVVGDVIGNKIKFKYKLSFWTQYEPVKKVLDWIWENRLIPRR